MSVHVPYAVPHRELTHQEQKNVIGVNMAMNVQEENISFNQVKGGRG
jgi:hypothetical protein